MKPNDLGRKFIVEEAKRVNIKDYLYDFRNKFKEALLGSVSDILKQNIELATTKTGFNGIRYWFKCPICSKRIGIILIHPITNKVGCRECLDLDYRKRRNKGMVESKLTDL